MQDYFLRHRILQQPSTWTTPHKGNTTIEGSEIHPQLIWTNNLISWCSLQLRLHLSLEFPNMHSLQKYLNVQVIFSTFYYSFVCDHLMLHQRCMEVFYEWLLRSFSVVSGCLSHMILVISNVLKTIQFSLKVQVFLQLLLFVIFVIWFVATF